MLRRIVASRWAAALRVALVTQGRIDLDAPGDPVSFR
jgi:hypothetical protein